MADESDDERVWAQVDAYLADALIPPDGALEAVHEANAAAGLPGIDVSPLQGKFLHLLVLLRGAKRILEIGTLGGYSTIWLARALPAEGQLITLEYEPRHAEVAAENIAGAGLSARVEIRVGAAADSLAALHAEGAEPFDLIFIDADKANNLVYLEWALKLARKGTLIVVDNVIRDGEVANPKSDDPGVLGTRAMFGRMATEPRISTTAIQTVGVKGYDGFAMALVVGEIDALRG